MAYTEKTAFEVKNSNIRFNDIQNVPGYFGAMDDADYVVADCDAGELCVSNALAPCEGYESFSILNGNTHQMIAKADGSAVAGYKGDHTGIYACNTHNVQQVVDQLGNVYNVGRNTLGLGLPAGERGVFTELIVGERYKFGEGNFSSLTEGHAYATISSGKWASASSAPVTAGNVYAVIERPSAFEKGTRFAFDGYILRICRV